MRSRAIAAGLITGLSACAPGAAQRPELGAPRAVGAAEADFHALFDGQSLANWRGYCRQSAPESWSVQDGALALTPASAQSGSMAGGDLVTQGEYENFELTLEWKISQAGNSGVFYLAPEVCKSEDHAETPIYELAPEMQLLDNERHPDATAGVNGDRQAGSLYDLIPADPQNVRAAGDWNQAGITVDHGRVSHQQNGQTVVLYELESEDWKARVAASKFKDWPGFAHPARRGHIALQDHGNAVWFRNIQIREL
jgi:Domain of Unknown Function (DUF1080)